jgi:hypothetical protein
MNGIGGVTAEKALRFSLAINSLSYKDTSLPYKMVQIIWIFYPWHKFEIHLKSQLLIVKVLGEEEYSWGREAVKLLECGIGGFFCLYA